MYKKLFFLSIPRSTASKHPVHAPVPGSGIPTNKVRPVIGVNLKILLQIPPNDDDNQQVYELTLFVGFNELKRNIGPNTIKRTPKNIDPPINSFIFTGIFVPILRFIFPFA